MLNLQQRKGGIYISVDTFLRFFIKTFNIFIFGELFLISIYNLLDKTLINEYKKNSIVLGKKIVNKLLTEFTKKYFNALNR